MWHQTRAQTPSQNSTTSIARCHTHAGKKLHASLPCPALLSLVIGIANLGLCCEAQLLHLKYLAGQVMTPSLLRINLEHEHACLDQKWHIYFMKISRKFTPTLIIYVRGMYGPVSRWGGTLVQHLGVKRPAPSMLTRSFPQANYQRYGIVSIPADRTTSMFKR